MLGKVTGLLYSSYSTPCNVEKQMGKTPSTIYIEYYKITSLSTLMTKHHNIIILTIMTVIYYIDQSTKLHKKFLTHIKITDNRQ